MRHDEAIKAVETGQAAELRYASFQARDAHASGRVVAYSDAPMVLIETEAGERIWWRRDLARIVPSGATGGDLRDFQTSGVVRGASKGDERG